MEHISHIVLGFNEKNVKNPHLARIALQFPDADQILYHLRSLQPHYKKHGDLIHNYSNEISDLIGHDHLLSDLSASSIHTDQDMYYDLFIEKFKEDLRKEAEFMTKRVADESLIHVYADRRFEQAINKRFPDERPKLIESINSVYSSKSLKKNIAGFLSEFLTYKGHEVSEKMIYGALEFCLVYMKIKLENPLYSRRIPKTKFLAQLNYKKRQKELESLDEKLISKAFEFFIANMPSNETIQKLLVPVEHDPKILIAPVKNYSFIQKFKDYLLNYHKKDEKIFNVFAPLYSWNI